MNGFLSIFVALGTTLHKAIFVMTIVFGMTSRGDAGDLPENVAIIVNSSSESSRRVAQAYAVLRDIPDSNLIWLNDVPNEDPVSVADFRDRILKPILLEIDRRGLSRQIDVIAYSSDFPTSVDISKDLEKLPEIPKVITSLGSLNGLTTLYQGVLSGSPSYVAADANWYVQLETAEAIRRPLQGDYFMAWQVADQAAVNSQYQVAFERFSSLSTTLGGYVPADLRAALAAAAIPSTPLACEALAQAVDHGFMDGHWLDSEPTFEKVKNDPTWQSIAQKLPRRSIADRPTRSFRSSTQWTPSGYPLDKGDTGRRYLLSVMLAVTSGRGTDVKEAIQQLSTSVSADGSMPDGVFLFTRTDDVRTQTRLPRFASAIDALKFEGSHAEIVDAAIPRGVSDVVGLTMGAADFDWAASTSKLVPGAIAENLTSFGGVLRENAGQTPLTVFLQGGAAGSSGTVTEPYAIQAKFPEPFLHAHYRRGVNLAEAFHQSIAAPYQLLIVGDPLCAPWQHPSKIEIDVEGLRSSEDRFSITLRGDQLESHSVEFFLDGVRQGSAKARPQMDLEIDQFPPGDHRLTVAILSQDDLTSRRFVFDVSRLPTGISKAELRLVTDNPSSITAYSEGADSIELKAFGSVILRKQGDRIVCDIDRDLPVDRPLRLIAIAHHGDTQVLSKTLVLP